MDSNELWKPIMGYEGLYEISSFGRVKSLPKVCNQTLALTREKFVGIRPANWYSTVCLINKCLNKYTKLAGGFAWIYKSAFTLLEAKLTQAQ